MKYLILLLSLVLFSCKSLNHLQTQTGTLAPKAMVVSAHPLATQIGTDILRQGGNAVDAMVGVHFALAVVLPAAGNIGGGGFMVSRMNDGRVHTLDFRETGPEAADKDMYLDEKGDVIKGLSWEGHLAGGVPGSVAGMIAAHDSLGKLPFRQLIQPSIDLAAKGFLLTEKEANGINNHLERLNTFSTQPHAYQKDSPWLPGDTIVHPDLAQTLERIRDNGMMGFYAGKTADLIVAEMKRGKGIITKKDLERYEAVWREPVTGTYRGYGVISMAPPSSGGIALVQLLKMIEPFPIREYGWQSPRAIHLMTEAERRVYADRAIHLGDTDFYPVPIHGLIDDAYLAERMKSYDPDKASLTADISEGAPAQPEHEETTHYSIVDTEGNAISVTTTINGGYGSHVVIGGAGFLLNNEMDDFSAKPGVPNYFGLVGTEANAIQPHKRMLSSMTPTILTKDNKLFMVVGTPGGSKIITSVFQAVVNVIDHGMTMQGAVSMPRFHHQWKPEWVYYEEGSFGKKLIRQLSKLGHTPKSRGAYSRIDAILVCPDGRLEGGADPRGDDRAAGF